MLTISKFTQFWKAHHPTIQSTLGSNTQNQKQTMLVSSSTESSSSTSSSYHHQQQQQQQQHEEYYYDYNDDVAMDSATTATTTTTSSSISSSGFADGSATTTMMNMNMSSKMNMNTITSSIIIDCNNRGAQLIRHGQYDMAIPILSDGLAAAKRAAKVMKEQQRQQQQQQPSKNTNNRMTDIDEWFTELIIESASKGIETTTASPSTHHLLHRHDEYVYESPIDLDYDDDMCHMLSVQCMVIMYNMALAFHWNALVEIEDDIEEKDCMNRNAIDMYEICYELMSTENINPGLHFIMILANNLGQCHIMLGNYEKAQQCLEHLISIQMYVMDNTTTTTRRRIRPRQVQQAWEGFTQNTSLLILSNRCASAA